MKKLNVLTRMLLLVALLVGSTSSVWAEGTATLPFNWTGGTKSALEAVTGVEAVVADKDYAAENAPYRIKFNDTGKYITIHTNEQPGTVTIGVKMIGGNKTSTITVQESADGTSFTKVQDLSISGNTNDVVNLATTTSFKSTTRYVKLYYTKGSNVGVGPITIARASSDPAIVVSTPVNIGADEDDNVITVNYDNFTPASASVSFFESDGTTPTTYDWISASINDDKNIAYHVDANTSGSARTAYLKVSSNAVTSNLVAITQSLPPIPYTLATSIVPGRHYIITSGTDGSVKAMGAQNTNNRAAVNISATSGTTNITSDAGVYEVLIEIDEKTGYYTIYDETTDGYLYAACGTGTGNTMKTYSTLDDYGRWTISIANDGEATILAQSGGRNNMRYNSGNSLFSCYVVDGQSPIYLFERDGDTGTQEATLSINAACNDRAATPTYYGTYSAPFAFVVPADLTVSAVGISEDKLVVTDYTTGAVVKANTGVMISSASAGNKTVTISSETGTEKAGNLLKASGGAGIEAGAMEAASASGTKFYRLTMHKGTDLGFYYGAENGAAFDLAANKAYLAVPAGSAKEGFSFITDEEETDGIKAVSTKVENGVRYNLAGQKVGADYKGIVIVNGKKYLNK